MPLLFRPADFQGKSKEQPAYVIARTAGARGGGEPQPPLGLGLGLGSGLALT